MNSWGISIKRFILYRFYYNVSIFSIPWTSIMHILIMGPVEQTVIAYKNGYKTIRV